MSSASKPTAFYGVLMITVEHLSMLDRALQMISDMTDQTPPPSTTDLQEDLRHVIMQLSMREDLDEQIMQLMPED